MALPFGTTGSLCPTFVPARLVCLPVKPAYTNTLSARLPFVLSGPWEASVTLLEATTPVKLPAKRCPGIFPVRDQTHEGPYFNGGSTATGVADSMPPAYPTRRVPKRNAKLQ